MKKFLPLILSLLFALTLSAQVVQKGIAVEYNEKAAKTALAGVEFRVQRAGSTASDAKGAFVLDFPTLKAGDRVAVRRIEKPGYEVFNKEAVEQWNINPSRAFTVVMCRSDKFKALKDRYSTNSEKRYESQYRRAKAELERLKKEGKLKEQEYFARLREVEAEYEKKLDNLDNYVDRFARIDLSELNAEEQAIIDLVQAGQIDEAIARYEKMNYLGKALKEISDIKEIEEAVNSLNELHEGKTADRDAYLAGVERTINTMLLAGDSKNNATIAEMYTTIADADTTNIDWLFKTGEFLYQYIGDYNKALSYFQTVLNSAKEKYGEESNEVANCYNNLGITCDELGNYPQSMEYHQKSIAIRKMVLGEDHFDVASCYNNIGNVFVSMGNYSEALENHQKALAIREKVLGENHPDVAACYINIGGVYGHMGDNPRALEYYHKALGVREKLLGEEDSDVAACYNNIGVVYSSIGNYPQSLVYYQKALAIRKKILGEEHPDVAICYDNIGNAYNSMGDYQQVVEYHQKALMIFEKVLGEEHTYVVGLNQSIGLAYFNLEKYSESINALMKSYIEYNKKEAENCAQIMALDYFIGHAFVMTNDLDNALKYWQHGLALCEKMPGIENSLKSMFQNFIEAIYATQSEEGGGK